MSNVEASNPSTYADWGQLAGYGFLLPWLLGFFLLTLGPVVASFCLSLTDYGGFAAPNWVGLENYRRIASDEPGRLGP
jgi:multiple sugar transport system permease protein